MKNGILPLEPGMGDGASRRRFILQIVQPGLEGLMDGSVSTLAPVFAAAFATRNSWTAFAVGLAATLGAGISMGFAEAASDDGSITGRGHAWVRGLVCGLMTALGGIGHTLPFLISNFDIAFVGSRRGACRTRHHLLDSSPLYEHIGSLGCDAGRIRRHPGFRNWGADRPFLVKY